MSTRKAILGRIKEALTNSAVIPTGQDRQAADVPIDVEAFKRCLPAVGSSKSAWRQLFALNAAALKAEFKLVADAEAAAHEINLLADQENWKMMGVHRGLLTSAILPHLDVELCKTDAPYPLTVLEQCEGGLTECEALIAQTGSVLVSSRSSGGRALSVLPPHHVVIATQDQLLPDLPAAFAYLRHKYHPDYPSCISFITGPSRTGDIERILVLGAHGPKKLTVLLLV